MPTRGDEVETDAMLILAMMVMCPPKNFGANRQHEPALQTDFVKISCVLQTTNIRGEISPASQIRSRASITRNANAE
jgi:hypothetical protein